MTNMYVRITRWLVLVAPILYLIGGTMPFMVFDGEISGYASLLQYHVVFDGESIDVPSADIINAKYIGATIILVTLAFATVFIRSRIFLYAVYMNEIVFSPIIHNLKKLLLKSLVFSKITLTVGGGRLVLDYELSQNNMVDIVLFAAVLAASTGLTLALLAEFSFEEE